MFVDRPEVLEVEMRAIDALGLEHLGDIADFEPVLVDLYEAEVFEVFEEDSEVHVLGLLAEVLEALHGSVSLPAVEDEDLLESLLEDLSLFGEDLPLELQLFLLLFELIHFFI